MQVNNLNILKMFYSGISLSNDPDKNCSILFRSAAIRFPQIKTVVFSDEEFINRWKADYEIIKNAFKLYFER